MSPPLKLASSRHIRGWHSLVYGQLSYTGQVYQSHPLQDYSLGGDEKIMPQEQDGKAVTRRPTRKTSRGWKNGKLWLGLWTSTGASTKDR